jgi:hypothetical protein
VAADEAKVAQEKKATLERSSGWCVKCICVPPTAIQRRRRLEGEAYFWRWSLLKEGRLSSFFFLFAGPTTGSSGGPVRAVVDMGVLEDNDDDDDDEGEDEEDEERERGRREIDGDGREKEEEEEYEGDE